MSQIRVGSWRDDYTGLMQVISGSIGHEKVHFEAPPANRLPAEMNHFLAWLNDTNIKEPKCSQDTALRDITELVQYEVLQKTAAGGRSTHYELRHYGFKR